MKSALPQASIVITCYNYARFVAFAIDSALAQTYPNVEIIVIDDGSTDGSERVIGEFGDRIRSIRQVNQGHIAACNRGYAEANGEVIIFLDADDVLAFDAVIEVMMVWQPSCAKVQYDLSIIDGTGAFLGRRFCNFLPGYDAIAVRDVFRRTGTYRWPVTTGNAYSRQFLAQVFPLRVGMGPDGYLNTVAPLYGDIITIPIQLGCYRIHGSNIWSQSGSDLDRLPTRISQRYCEVAALHQHAVGREVKLPKGNILDSELVFINYRLMAAKLGQSYQGADVDSPLRLWRKGVQAVFGEPVPARLKLAHWTWLCLLALAPRRVARLLCHWRFNRAAYRRPLRQTVANVMRRN